MNNSKQINKYNMIKYQFNHILTSLVGIGKENITTKQITIIYDEAIKNQISNTEY